MGPPKLEKSQSVRSSEVDSRFGSGVKPSSSMINSEQSKVLTGSDINMMKLEKGEQVEFQCYTP